MEGNREGEKGGTVEDKSVVNADDAQTNIVTHDAQINIDTDDAETNSNERFVKIDTHVVNTIVTHDVNTIDERVVNTIDTHVVNIDERVAQIHIDTDVAPTNIHTHVVNGSDTHDVNIDLVVFIVDTHVVHMIHSQTSIDTHIVMFDGDFSQSPSSPTFSLAQSLAFTQPQSPTRPSTTSLIPTMIVVSIPLSS